MEENFKHTADSRTEQVQILMPEQINGNKRLFGGKLMEWIDVVAAVTARRHANCNVTTVCVDHLHFKAPAYRNDLIVLVGQITYVGSTSMEVRVDTFVETLAGAKKLINRAYLVLVALDENEKPVRVPRIVPDTPQERAEWERAAERNRRRRERMQEEAAAEQQLSSL